MNALTSHELFQLCRSEPRFDTIEIEYADDGSWLVTTMMSDRAYLDSATDVDEPLENALDRVADEVKAYLRHLKEKWG